MLRSAPWALRVTGRGTLSTGTVSSSLGLPQQYDIPSNSGSSSIYMADRIYDGCVPGVKVEIEYANGFCGVIQGLILESHCEAHETG